ncbi:MAG: AsmA-like C-terminal region-containing protein, partial [Tepidisphaeraceae bacterium]
RCSDLNGVLSFHPPNAYYPPPLDAFFKKVQPGGEFYFTGHGVLDRARRRPLEYDLLLSCDNATLAVLNPRFNVFQIKFDAEATQDSVQVPNFQCRTLEGRLRVEQGRLAMAVPDAFSANVFIDRISVPKVVALAVPPKAGGINLQGLADVHASIWGNARGSGQAVTDSLKAEGQFELYGGDLWDLPALKKITTSSKLAKDALTIGQAAALFRVGNRLIELQNAVISAPAAGVQGYGTIGFDGNLNIYAIVVLLSDWREKLKGTSMNFLADTLGTVQQALNEATEHLLYQYHVYGPANDPEAKAEAIPDLKKNSAQDVTTMLQHTDADRPITLLSPNGASQ